MNKDVIAQEIASCGDLNEMRAVVALLTARMMQMGWLHSADALQAADNQIRIDIVITKHNDRLRRECSKWDEVDI